MAEDYPRTLMELERRFTGEQACREYLFTLRWPQGFVCRRCAGDSAWPMTRGKWLCRDCRAQVSVAAGTIFQDSKLPLTLWFRAMWHVTSQKNGVSALGLQRVLGLDRPPLKTPRFEGQYHRGPHWLLDKDPCDGPTRFLRFPTTL